MENLKKYWFVGIIVVVMVVGTVIFSKEQLSTVFKGKKVDGKDLIYELAGENKNADDYYKEIFDKYAGSEGYKLFERAILDSIESSEEIVAESRKLADERIKAVSAQGAAKLDELEAAVINSGYSGLKELNILFENNAKLLDVERDYIDAQGSDFLNTYFEAKSPRIVRHILVKMADPKAPTAAETKLLEDVKAALAEGMDFKDAAVKFSDDGSAIDGGLIGFMDKDSQLVSEFITAAIATNAGETSEWFDTQYGKHIVMVDATDYDTLKADDGFISAAEKANPQIRFASIWEKSQSLDLEITFNNKELETLIKEFTKIEGDE